MKVSFKSERTNGVIKAHMAMSAFLDLKLPDMWKTSSPTIDAELMGNASNRAVYYRLNQEWMGGHVGDGLAIVIEPNRTVSIFIGPRGEEDK